MSELSIYNVLYITGDRLVDRLINVIRDVIIIIIIIYEFIFKHNIYRCAFISL